MLHNTGWILGQKIGRADQHVQFRELFRQDGDFHNAFNREVAVDNANGWDGRPDNWLVGQLWYQRAERAVDRGLPLKVKSPLIFHADNPMSRINYSTTIEDEGVLGVHRPTVLVRGGQRLGPVRTPPHSYVVGT